jgi:hypothetical protein
MAMACGLALNEDGTIHCYRCHIDTMLTRVRLMSLTDRDNTVVAEIRCPSCDAPGVLVVDSGPHASHIELHALKTFESLGSISA